MFVPVGKGVETAEQDTQSSENNGLHTVLTNHLLAHHLNLRSRVFRTTGDLSDIENGVSKYDFNFTSDISFG